MSEETKELKQNSSASSGYKTPITEKPGFILGFLGVFFVLYVLTIVTG